MSDFQPQTAKDLFSRQKKDINSLKRRQKSSLVALVGTVRSGFVVNTPNVDIPGSPDPITVVSWISGYTPTTGHSVLMIRSKAGWHIIGRLVTA